MCLGHTEWPSPCPLHWLDETWPRQKQTYLSSAPHHHRAPAEVNVPEGGTPEPDSALIPATETWLRAALPGLTEGPQAPGEDGPCKGEFVLSLTTEGLRKSHKSCSGKGPGVRPLYEAP